MSKDDQKIVWNTQSKQPEPQTQPTDVDVDVNQSVDINKGIELDPALADIVDTAPSDRTIDIGNSSQSIDEMKAQIDAAFSDTTSVLDVRNDEAPLVDTSSGADKSIDDIKAGINAAFAGTTTAGTALSNDGDVIDTDEVHDVSLEDLKAGMDAAFSKKVFKITDEDTDLAQPLESLDSNDTNSELLESRPVTEEGGFVQPDLEGVEMRPETGVEKTYYSEMSEAMDAKQGSTMSELLERDRRRKAIAKNKSIASTRNLFFLLGALVFLGIAAFVLFGIFKPQQKVEFIKKQTVSSLVFANEHLGLNISDLGEFKTNSAIQQAAQAQTPIDQITHLYYVTEEGKVLKRLGFKELIQQADIRLPAAIQSNTEDNFMHGVYKGDKEYPFLIFKTDSYDQAFNGMRRWEDNMIEHLSAFLDVNEAALDPAKGSSAFSDEVLRNKNVRIARFIPAEKKNILRDLFSFMQNVLPKTTDVASVAFAQGTSFQDGFSNSNLNDSLICSALVCRNQEGNEVLDIFQGQPGITCAEEQVDPADQGNYSQVQCNLSTSAITNGPITTSGSLTDTQLYTAPVCFNRWNGDRVPYDVETDTYEETNSDNLVCFDSYVCYPIVCKDSAGLQVDVSQEGQPGITCAPGQADVDAPIDINDPAPKQCRNFNDLLVLDSLYGKQFCFDDYGNYYSRPGPGVSCVNPLDRDVRVCIDRDNLIFPIFHEMTEEEEANDWRFCFDQRPGLGSLSETAQAPNCNVQTPMLRRGAGRSAVGEQFTTDALFLSASTTYYYRACAGDEDFAIYQGSTQSFTTPPVLGQSYDSDYITPATPENIVGTKHATAVSVNAAQLRGELYGLQILRPDGQPLANANMDAQGNAFVGGQLVMPNVTDGEGNILSNGSTDGQGYVLAGGVERYPHNTKTWFTIGTAQVGDQFYSINQAARDQLAQIAGVMSSLHYYMNGGIPGVNITIDEDGDGQDDIEQLVNTLNQIVTNNDVFNIENQFDFDNDGERDYVILRVAQAVQYAESILNFIETDPLFVDSFALVEAFLTALGAGDGFFNTVDDIVDALRDAIFYFKDILGLSHSLTWTTLNGGITFLTNQAGTLYIGATGEVVNVVQTVFVELGLPVEVTGEFDLQTQEALIELQAANGIDPTGVLDLETMELIEQMIEAGGSVLVNPAILDLSVVGAEGLFGGFLPYTLQLCPSDFPVPSPTTTPVTGPTVRDHVQTFVAEIMPQFRAWAAGMVAQQAVAQSAGIVVSNDRTYVNTSGDDFYGFDADITLPPTSTSYVELFNETTGDIYVLDDLVNPGANPITGDISYPNDEVDILLFGNSGYVPNYTLQNNNVYAIRLVDDIGNVLDSFNLGTYPRLDLTLAEPQNPDWASNAPWYHEYIIEGYLYPPNTDVKLYMYDATDDEMRALNSGTYPSDFQGQFGATDHFFDDVFGWPAIDADNGNVTHDYQIFLGQSDSSFSSWSAFDSSIPLTGIIDVPDVHYEPFGISEFTADQTTVPVGQEVDFVINGFNPDGSSDWVNIVLTANGNNFSNVSSMQYHVQGLATLPGTVPAGIYDVQAIMTSNDGDVSAPANIQIIVGDLAQTVVLNSFTADQTVINAGEDVTFTMDVSNPDNELLGYRWYSGQSPTPDSTSPNNPTVLTYATQGVYDAYVVVDIYEAGSIIDSITSETITINVSDPVEPITLNTYVASAPVVEVGNSVMFTANVSNPGFLLLTYQWYSGQSPTPEASGLESFSPLTYTSPGVYDAYLVVEAYDGGIIADTITSDTISITVTPPSTAEPLEVVSFDANETTVNIGEPVILTATVDNPEGLDLSYEWYSGGGATPDDITTSPTTSISYSAIGTYLARLRVVGFEAGSAMDTANSESVQITVTNSGPGPGPGTPTPPSGTVGYNLCVVEADGIIVAEGIIDANGNLIVDGTLSGVGLVDANGNVLPIGTVGANGVLDADGVIDADGEVISVGIVDLSGAVVADQVVDAEGNVITSGVLMPNGSIIADAYVDPYGNLVATGTIDEFGNISGTGIVTPAGDLIASGVIDAEGNVHPNASVTADGTIIPEGALIISGLLGTDGGYVEPTYPVIAEGIVDGNGTLITNGIIDGEGNVIVDGVVVGSGVVDGSGNLVTDAIIDAAGNVIPIGAVLATGVVDGEGNLVTSGYIDSAGNVIVDGAIVASGVLDGEGNLITDAFIDANGNVVPGEFAVNVSGIVNAEGNIIPVGSLLATGIVDPEGNLITSGYIDSVGNVIVDGAVVASGVVDGEGNLITDAFIDANGNVIAAEVIDVNGVVVDVEGGYVQPTYSIIVTGVLDANGSLVTNGYIDSEGNIIVDGVVVGSGVVDGSGNLITDAFIDAEGNVVAVGSVLVTGVVDANGNLITNAFIDANGNVIVDGVIVASDILDANGNIITNAFIDAAGNVIPIGAVLATDILDANGNVITNGYIDAGGNIYVNGTIVGTGATDSNGNIITNAFIDANGNVVPADLVLANGSLDANGNVIPSGNIVGTGILDANGNLITNAVIDSNGNVIVNGVVVGSGVVDSDGNLVTNAFIDANGNVMTVGPILATEVTDANGNIVTNAIIDSDGNIIVDGNIIGSGLVDANGNVITNAFIDANGNVIGIGSILATDILDANGNVVTNAIIDANGDIYVNGQLVGTNATDANGTLITNAIIDANGNVIAAGGVSTSGIFDVNGNLITNATIDGQGNIIQNGEVVGTGVVDNNGNLVTNAIIDSNGNILVAAQTATTGGLFDVNGNLITNATIDGQGNIIQNGEVVGTGVVDNNGNLVTNAIIDSNGNVLVAAETTGTSGLFDANGNLITNATIDSNGNIMQNGQILGSGVTDANGNLITNAIIDGSGNIIVAGSSYNHGITDANGQLITNAVIDENGNIVQGGQIIGTGVTDSKGNLITDATIDGQGNVIPNSFQGGNGVVEGYGQSYLGYATVGEYVPGTASGTVVSTPNGLILNEYIEQDVAIGTMSDDVLGTQMVLASEGYYNGNLNGVYDQTTIEAIKAFQTDYFIGSSGFFDPLIIREFQVATGLASGGDLNTATIEEFQRLAELPVTGMLDTATIEAMAASGLINSEVIDAYRARYNFGAGGLDANTIRAFQAERGLPQTGIIDEETFEAMIETPAPNGILDEATRTMINRIIEREGYLGSGYTIGANGQLVGYGLLGRNLRSASVVDADGTVTEIQTNVLLEGDPVLMYTFLDQETILITTHESVITEIIKRRSYGDIFE